MSLEEKIQATDLHMLSARVENETCILYLSLLDLTRSLDAKLKIFCNFIILSFATSFQQKVIFIHVYLYMHRGRSQSFL